MKQKINRKRRFIAVLCTCPTLSQATRIGRVLLDKRLIACVSILPAIFSIYRWKGKVCKAKEFLFVAKTEEALFKDVEIMIRSIHGYQVPEIIAFPITKASNPYLQWISESVSRNR